MTTNQLKETIRKHFVNLKYAVDMKPMFDMIDELDRLADIGKAVDNAFLQGFELSVDNGEWCCGDYIYNLYIIAENSDELVEWYRKEVLE